jgi:two-component system, OmpR family, response regulator VicR
MRVLYVEDEPFLSKIVKESLETRGFEVYLVEDGNLAMPAFEYFTPDICVLDIMLPGIDGYAIGKSIRARFAQMPIIFVTAKQQTSDVVQGFESGGNDYLRKPFSIEELIVRMGNLVRMSKGNVIEPIMSTKLSIGRFQYDTVKQVLKIGDKERQLSFREAQLMEFLGTQPNMTIERKAILTEIWGHDSIFNSRNLDVYITHLREYLREDDGVQLITLKGVGYRLLTGK